MADPWDVAEVVRRFEAQSRTALPRAPLNSALAGVIARDRDLAAMLLHAPPTQRQPVLLLAAIHDVLLRDPAADPLARWYPNLTDRPRDPGDPALPATLRSFATAHAPELVRLVSTRHVQTNEIGRAALIVAALGELDDLAPDRPLAHLDVGASAGLNLLLPRYRYRFGDGPVFGAADEDAPLLVCGTRGDRPAPARLPHLAAACGVDLRPIDVTDPDEARWLEACCWPDQADRFARLHQAIAIAQRHPPELLHGDAAAATAPLVERIASRGHPVVTTTWALNYLPPEDRRGFVTALDDVGARLDVDWILAESPAQTPELPHPDDLTDDHVTALTLVSWRSGSRSVRHLAVCHPHGYWLHWR